MKSESEEIGKLMAGNPAEEDWFAMEDHAVSKKARLLVEEKEEDSPAAMEEEEKLAPVIAEECESGHQPIIEGETKADQITPVEEKENSAAMEELLEPVTDDEESKLDIEFDMYRGIDITDSDDEYVPPKEDRNAQNDIERYYKVVRESQGYDIDLYPPASVRSTFMPRSLSDKLFYERALKVMEFAIERINSDAKDKLGKSYEFVSIEKAVETRTMSLLLTFKAKEFDAETKHTDADAPIRILQTRVWARPFQEFELEEWRFKPGTT